MIYLEHWRRLHHLSGGFADDRKCLSWAAAQVNTQLPILHHGRAGHLAAHQTHRHYSL